MSAAVKTHACFILSRARHGSMDASVLTYTGCAVYSVSTVVTMIVMLVFGLGLRGLALAKKFKANIFRGLQNLPHLHSKNVADL